jgi:dihydrofolate reductase
MKKRPGKNIAIAGSATLVRSLLSEGLVDELRLLLFPIVLGDGRTSFDDWAALMPMRLAGSRTLSNSVLLLVYEPTTTTGAPRGLGRASARG